MGRVGDWHCPICRSGGNEISKDMHANCDGAPMSAEMGRKVQRVLEAARAWRHARFPENSDIRYALIEAIDALDAPAGRYYSDGGVVRDRRNNGIIMARAEHETAVADKIAAALNAKEECNEG